MNLLLKNIYYGIPKPYRKFLKSSLFLLSNINFSFFPEEGLQLLKLKIRLYFYFHRQESYKYKNELEFIKKHSTSSFSYSFIFPYDFIFRYNYKDINVSYDETLSMFYVMHYDRRLYYNKNFISKEEVRSAYFCTLIEQDKSSPHKYTNENVDITEDCIVVDIGAAEGNFGLEQIDKIKRLIIIEADKIWYDALKATFSPWKDKVEIIIKNASDRDDSTNISLDFLSDKYKLGFIKIDVEGGEINILRGASKLLKQKENKIVIATYHKENDAENISSMLKSYEFACNYTNGYMLFPLRKLNPPYFRRGLIQAKK